MKPTRLNLARTTVLALTALLCGCAHGPESVFVRSTSAFAKGDVGAGMKHFSGRLQESKSRNDLEYYYSVEDNRKGVAFLLEDMKFQILEEDEDSAVGRVIWTTGQIEPVYFVREDGHWKIDLPPASSPSEVEPGTPITGTP